MMAAFESGRSGGMDQADKSDGAPSRMSYHHGDLRRNLIQSVRGLVETHGPDGFSIAEASRAAGVSTAAPYKHFKDKTAILHAVVEDAMQRMAEAMAGAITAYPVGSIERIDAIGQSYIDFARDQPGVFRLMFGLTRGHDDDEVIMAHGRNAFGIVIQCVADHLGIEPDAELARQRAYMLWCFVHGHSFLIIDDKTSKQGLNIDEKALLSTVSRGIMATAKEMVDS